MALELLSEPKRLLIDGADSLFTLKRDPLIDAVLMCCQPHKGNWFVIYK